MNFITKSNSDKNIEIIKVILRNSLGKNITQFSDEKLKNENPKTFSIQLRIETETKNEKFQSPKAKYIIDEKIKTLKILGEDFLKNNKRVFKIILNNK